MSRKTPEDYHKLAEERGFRWLGPEVPNARTKTSWQCERGHDWEAHCNSIQQGRGCPVCANRVPKTPADYHTLAEGRGFRWLGPEVPNTGTKTEWECQEGHRWEITFSSIQRGSGCPFCAGRASRMPADYHALARERSFRWLGPEVSSTKTLTGWECEHHHQWEARYSDIQQGSGCPFCAGKAPRIPADYHALAGERSFRWLGPEVSSTKTLTGWECKHGHQWEARYNDIRKGSGCPACAGNLAKAPTDYYALAEERGLRWIGPEVPNNHTTTEWECPEGHRWEIPYSSIQQGRGCPFCAGLAPKVPTDYHTLADERDFRWVGPEVSGIHVKTGWECEQGHKWEAPYSSIQQGRGCPFCAGKAPRIPADYHALAGERSFRWLGPEVPTIHAKTRWECEESHRWEAPFNSIRRGHGCPFCAGLAPKVPTDYHTLADERDFRWVGPEVSGVHVKTGWECEQGHRWETPYSSIQQGTGCPHCSDMIHGARVSQVQRELCEMLGGELNEPFGRYNVDVALHIEGSAIAVEYDSWYWHAGREENDAQRDKEMIEAGWHMLRVKSNTLLPTREQLDNAIARLLAGEDQIEVVLDDWGRGPTRFEP